MSAPVGFVNADEVLAVLTADWQRTAAVAVAVGLVTPEQANWNADPHNDHVPYVGRVDNVRRVLESLRSRVEYRYEIEHPGGSKQYLQWRLAS